MFGCTSLAGGNATYDICSVVHHFLGVEGTNFSSDALDKYGCFARKKDGHAFTTFKFSDMSFFQATTARWAASAKVLARMMGSPDRARILRPSST